MSVDDPLIGKTLGDYTIQALLGRGGMSRVYRGLDENLQRFAAVKVISGDFATTSEEEYTRRFQTEARAIAHLRHANIVGVYQFGRSEGIYYMAQVFLEGEDLRMLLRKYASDEQRMPIPEVLHIIRDVAGALDYAHEHGVIHRDIKPSNIMLERRTGRAILMDFGLALSVSEGTTGDTFGSAHYIAPEQAVSSAKSVPQSDLYSLGVVIYEMLTGQVPFDDPSVMSVALKHLNEVPPPPTLFNPDLPAAAEAVILRALDKDPNRRFASGQELYAALEAAFPSIAPGDEFSGISVADMLERPSKPVQPAESFLERFASDSQARSWGPETPISLSASRPEKLSGVGEKLVRHKTQREEEEALESLTEDDLLANEEELSSFLDTLSDPSEIGLVGPDARGIRQSDLRDILAPPQPSPIRAITKRRSRVGVLLTLILVLIIAGGALYLGTQAGNRDGEDETATGVLSAANQTGTAVALAESGGTVSPGPGENESATPTRVNTASPATETPIQTPPPPTSAGTETTPAETALAETEAGAIPLTDGATGSPTATATAESSATPTHTPTATATPTVTFTPTNTSTATDTATATVTPSDTPTRRPPVTVPPFDGEPNLNLIYNNSEFLLVNVSQDTLDVSRLVFEQELSDGRVRTFGVNLWNRRSITEKPVEMGAGGCYQLVTADATQATPSRRICPRFLGWYRSYDVNRYFWVPDQPGAVFHVRLTDDDTVLAICAIEAGICPLYYNPSGGDGQTPAIAVVPTRTPTATPTLRPTRTLSPTPAGGHEPNIRLVYDDDDFRLINISNTSLNVSQLVFEQILPDGQELAFEAALWERDGILESPRQTSPEGCFQLVTVNGTPLRFSNPDCPQFLGYYQTSVTQRYFWLSRNGSASFVVRLAASPTPLTTCSIEAGECLFYLPQ
jgi:serine/threonine protein kinase